MISVVINSDTRQGYKNDQSQVGEFENGQPNGTRSMDFLTEGVKNKLRFFRGYEIQCVLFIDEHEPIPENIFMEIAGIVHACGNNSKLICKPNDRTKYRWNDYLYLEALKLAEGSYVVHFDNDANAFRNDDSDIIEQYFKWLDNGYKYVCCPIMPTMKENWYWASTQFFICKKDTLNISEIEQSLYTPLRGMHNPCLEHTLGILAGSGKVLYPLRDDSSYIIFCWWAYKSGLLKELNKLPYPDVVKFLSKCNMTTTSF